MQKLKNLPGVKFVMLQAQKTEMKHGKYVVNVESSETQSVSIVALV